MELLKDILAHEVFPAVGCTEPIACAYACAAAVEQLIGERLHDGAGVLWVTHDAAQARRIAKRCLAVENGRVHATIL